MQKPVILKNWELSMHIVSTRSGLRELSDARLMWIKIRINEKSVDAYQALISEPIIPARMVATTSPSNPFVATIPATMVANAAVGPEI